MMPHGPWTEKACADFVLAPCQGPMCPAFLPREKIYPGEGQSPKGPGMSRRVKLKPGHKESQHHVERTSLLYPGFDCGSGNHLFCCPIRFAKVSNGNCKRKQQWHWNRTRMAGWNPEFVNLARSQPPTDLVLHLRPINGVQRQAVNLECRLIWTETSREQPLGGILVVDVQNSSQCPSITLASNLFSAAPPLNMKRTKANN